MLESFGSWQYGIPDPLVVQGRSVWCSKGACQLLEGEVCAVIMKAGYQYLLAEAVFLKIQLTFKHSISQLCGGHQWVFTMYSLPVLSRGG